MNKNQTTYFLSIGITVTGKITSIAIGELINVTPGNKYTSELRLATIVGSNINLNKNTPESRINRFFTCFSCSFTHPN
jgi:hypothetical protein